MSLLPAVLWQKAEIQYLSQRKVILENLRCEGLDLDAKKFVRCTRPRPIGCILEDIPDLIASLITSRIQWEVAAIMANAPKQYDILVRDVIAHAKNELYELKNRVLETMHTLSPEERKPLFFAKLNDAINKPSESVIEKLNDQFASKSFINSEYVALLKLDSKIDTPDWGRKETDFGDAVDVLLICALKDEYDQVLKVSDCIQAPGWYEHPLASGWLVADAGFTTAGGTLRIRATHASHMGREQVQAVASKLIHEQPARCIAMSGICAGRRGKVALGDVIFAERLWSYDAGKLTVENGESKFQGDPIQYNPAKVWVQRMQHVAIPPPNTSWLSSRPTLPLEHQENWVMLRVLAGEEPNRHADFNAVCPNWSDVLPRLWKRGWLEKPMTLTESGRQHVENLNLLHLAKQAAPAEFKIHVAPMATGATVSEDEGIFPRLADSMRKVLGIEMEASALGALGEVHDIPVIVAKGVSDYGDPFKDDRYREFAARASAELLITFLRNAADLLPVKCMPTSLAAAGHPASSSVDNIPTDLINVLAEEYPDVQHARALWQRAGGKVSDVENISRPRDLWQRLWQHSMQGASVRPEKLLQAALEDLPDNAVLRQHLSMLNESKTT